MKTVRGLGAVLALACVVTSGCRPSDSATPPPPPSGSATVRPSSSAAPSWSLTAPGQATSAVRALQLQAKGLPVFKIDITATTATLHAVKDGQVVAWTWEKGVVQPTESDIWYHEQTTFSPDRFDFHDLGAIFASAGQISGSTSSQELQIVEYNQHQVLMTVTTRPESMPVFFRPDGTAINQLEFPSAAAFAEALKDTTSSSARVLSIGWSSEAGFWADAAGSQPGHIDRTTRQAKIPAWSASRKAAVDNTGFRPQLIDTAVLAKLLDEVRVWESKPEARTSFVIERRASMAAPVIVFDVEGTKVVTTLSGQRIRGLLDG